MNKSLLERLLDFYGISYEEYQNITSDVDFSNFALGHSFNEMDKAVDLVKNTIAKNGKIIVYGDYDADGMMGTSILTKMFQYYGYINDYYLPNRYKDGYGINMAHAEQYVKAHYDLVITVDNGVSAFEPIDFLRKNGVNVLVLDHHQEQGKLPNANVIIHPSISKFGETASSGAFTAFMFSISFLGYVDKYLATLASISLISDMMPIREYNRSLLRAAINTYTPGEFLPLHLLGDGEKFDETLIGMKIAPRINSIGRLVDDESINDIVKFFTTNNTDFILNYFSYILECNETRKNLIKETAINLDNDCSQKAIVLRGDFKEGLIGLIANSLTSKNHVPSIVFTKCGNGELKGSARAPEGFDVVEAFNSLSDILIVYGGHSLAGGCSIKEENYELFKNRFIEYANNFVIQNNDKKFIQISITELNSENYELINSFSPFGETWKAPLLKITHIKTDPLTYSRDQKHILSYLGFNLKLTGFNCSKELVSRYDFIDCFGYFKKGSFKGKSYLDFQIKDYQESK